LVAGNVLLAGTFTVSRALFEQVGGYRAGLAFGENTDLWLRLRHELRRGTWSVAGTERALVRVNARRRAPDHQRIYGAASAVIPDMSELLADDPHSMARILSVGGVAAWHVGDRRRAMQWTWAAWCREPTNTRHGLRLMRAAVTRPGSTTTAGEHA
jgi:hypothetical protein